MSEPYTVRCFSRPFSLVSRAARLAAVVAISILLSSCERAVDFSTWVVAYNRSVDMAQNEIALLNVLRAGDNMPMVMSSVQVVRGNGSTSAVMGAMGGVSRTSYALQSFTWIDSLTASVAPTAALTVTDGFNFDVAILDTAEFEQGFLTPIRASTLSLFLQRGIPISVLLNLLVESGTFNKADGSSVTVYNDPASSSYSDFQDHLQKALRLGVTTEPPIPFVPVGPVLTAAEVKANIRSVVEGTRGGLLLMPAPGGFQLNMPNALVRICFMNADPSGPQMPQEMLCRISPKRKPQTAEGRSASGKGGPKIQAMDRGTLSFTFRSTRDVYTYLGHLVRAEVEQGPGVSPMVEQLRPKQLGGPRLVPLFHIVKDRPGTNNLVEVSYRNNHYSVPKDDSSYSAEVLNILDELVKLSKSVNAIPPTGTVVLR